MSRIEERNQAYQQYKSVSETGNLSEGDFIAGAEWADETMLEKVCDWVNEVIISDYVDVRHADLTMFMQFNLEKFINDLRKAVE